MLGPKQVLFLLDDSPAMQEMVKEIANRFGWKLLSARTVEQAESIVNCDTCVGAAMIDLMIPIKNSALTVIDPLILEGNELRTQITTRGVTTEVRQEKELRLDTIDEQIESLVEDDGGIQFLRSESGRKLCAVQGIKLAIFSSRRPDMVYPGQSVDMQTQVLKAIGREPDEWFEKPVPPADLEDWLITHLEVTKH